MELRHFTQVRPLCLVPFSLSGFVVDADRAHSAAVPTLSMQCNQVARQAFSFIIAGAHLPDKSTPIFIAHSHGPVARLY